MNIKFPALILSLSLSLSLLAGCAATASSAVQMPEAEETGKIAVIRNLVDDDHTTQFLAGAVSEGEAAGYTVDTFVSGGDDEKTQSFFRDAVAAGYDGILLSHGKEDYSAELIRTAAEAGIPVVTFDTVVKEDIDGLTQTSQNDEQLAQLSLQALTNGFEQPVRVVKVWYSGGLLPFERRNAVYEELEAAGVIETVAVVDPDIANAQGDTQTQLAEVLQSYAVGEIDGVWACWDELAKGAWTAIDAAGRSELRLVSIDISDTDRALMESSGGVWSATAAVDANMIGREDMKLLLQKLAGETTEPNVSFDGTLYTLDGGKVTAQQ